MSVIFDGTNVKYGTLPNFSYIHRTKACALVVWVKDLAGSTQQHLAGMDQNAGGSTRYTSICYRGNAGGQISIVRASTETHHNLGAPVAGAWNVALFSRPNSATAVATPSALNSADSSPSTLINQDFELVRFIVGARRIAGGSTYTDLANCKVGGFALYNTELTESQINQYQGGAHPSEVTDGLVDYLIFSGTGTATTMLTNAGTTMTFVGSPALDTDIPFSDYQVTDVNGDEEVDIDSTGNTITVAGFTNPISSIVIGGKSATGISGSDPNYTFTMPGFSHGLSYPEPDATHDLVASDASANSAEMPVLLNSPTGMTSVTISSPITDDDRFMGYWMALNGYAPVNGDKMITINADVIGASDTGVTADNPVETTIYHWVAATGVIYEYNVSVTEAGIISASITSTQITASSITSSSITARSL